MFDPVGFTKCIRDNLKKRGFAKARIDDLVNDFTARQRLFERQGFDAATAAGMASNGMYTHLNRVARERVKRTAAMMRTQASNIAAVSAGVNAPVSQFVLDGKKGSRGTAIARAAVSLIENDPRFSTLSYSGRKEVIRGQLYALFGSTLEAVGKGAFGLQKGKAHLKNIAREILGKNTGDAAAKAVSQAWTKIDDVAVQLFNNAGGTLNRLDKYLPQSMNAVKMAKAGRDAWVSHHMRLVDWDRTLWPDGTVIDPAQRVDVLKNVYDTLTTDGANKIDAKAFRGQGRALGNQIDNHRFMHYKGPEEWLEAHEAYSEGNVFEVLVRHIEDMSHKIAAIETFGPSPEVTRSNIRSIVRKAAAAEGPEALAHAEAVLHNKFDPMFETVMRQNPMDPHSTFGALVTGTSNILTSALLGSASILAIPGDAMQTALVRRLNNMGVFDGVGTYIKALATDTKFAREIATQSGFIFDEVVMSNYSQQRWTGVATVGPAASRFLSEATMRLSLLAGHTRSARWAVQSEFMGMMQRSRNIEFNDLPFAHVMARYGIDATMWDAFRKNVVPWQPRKDVNFLRPIDLLNTNLPDRQQLYRAFQTMIFDEARIMVPESTIEGATLLRGTTRPDTLSGALLYSFSMYKNFPVSFQMIYGRVGMTSPTTRGRAAFYASLIAGMTLVGALGTQLREISRGRDPMPMDNPAFFGKALLSGGGMSIWGDFLFAGVNQYGQGPQDIIAGPIGQFLGDTTDLVLGDVFQFADTLGTLEKGNFESTTASKAVEWARRYTPGSSIWWSRLVSERYIFDQLENLADPKAYAKRKRRQARMKRERGNGYWWKPGETAPRRAPQIGG